MGARRFCPFKLEGLDLSPTPHEAITKACPIRKGLVSPGRRDHELQNAMMGVRAQFYREMQSNRLVTEVSEWLGVDSKLVGDFCRLQWRVVHGLQGSNNSIRRDGIKES